MIKDKLSIYKDISHIIFINSNSGNLIDENSNFNKSKIKPQSFSFSKNAKTEGKTKKKKLTQNEKNYEKEENILKSLILNLIENNYKYVSYAYGGFEKIHDEIINNRNNAYSKITLLNHIKEKCDICKKILKTSKTLNQSHDKLPNIFSNLFKNSIKSKNEINKNEIIINN